MAEPWWAADTARNISFTIAFGAAAIAAVSAGFAERFSSRGERKPLVRSLYAVEGVVGLVLLAAGLYALASGQPRYVWFATGFTGLMFAAVCLPMFFTVDSAYRKAEERRLAAELLRRS